MFRDRSRQTECPTTDEEKRKLPGALGSLLWISVDVKVLLTKVIFSTEADIVKTNRLTHDYEKDKVTMLSNTFISEGTEPGTHRLE
jgi:hypothetical protein